ncbi:MAG: hypothetical protein ACI4J7_02385 [Ruminiclostridium sp.]
MSYYNEMSESALRANKLRKVTYIIAIILAPIFVIVLNKLFLFANDYYNDYSWNNDMLFRMAVNLGVPLACLPHGIAHWARTCKFLLGKVFVIFGAFCSVGIIIIPFFVFGLAALCFVVSFLIAIVGFGHIFWVIDTVLLIFRKPLVYIYEHSFYQ